MANSLLRSTILFNYTNIPNHNIPIERIDLCCICLEPNNDTSKPIQTIDIRCNCPQLYHPACLEQIKTNHKKCPICRKRSSNVDNKYEFTGMVFVLVFIITLMVACTSFGAYFDRYCDNKIKMCKYYPVYGILSSNKIVEDYNPNTFHITYQLISYYNYTSNHNNYQCVSNTVHDYDTYNEAIAISSKIIGISQTIYASYHDENICALTYKYWGKPYLLYCFVLSMSWSITVLVMIVYISWVVCTTPITVTPSNRRFVDFKMIVGALLFTLQTLLSWATIICFGVSLIAYGKIDT